jgi:DNA invertase Pin-like site-specific DNA recombinase
MSIIVYNLGELRQALSGLGSALLIGYVRVSTDGKHQDTSVERQIFFYEQKEVDLILVERESGRTDDHPLYQELIRLISLGRVREVIASRNDRLNRNSVEMNFFYNLCTDVGTAAETLDCRTYLWLVALVSPT